MSEAGKAVFLSYASQDKDVAKRICDALRAAGVEVWFDQSELRGGDAWDAMIRKRIKECAMFIPVITPTTNARAEGYFRLEWKLAVDRSHLMADDAPFLFPIVVGDISDATARVPDKFREVQWTRLRLDETPAELGARVARLLSGVAGVADPGPASARPATRRGVPTRWQWWMIFPVAGTIMGLMFAALPFWKAMNRPPRPEPAKAGAPEKSAVPVSEVDQLVRQAREIVYDPDSARNEFALAENLLKRATDLAPTSGSAWAASALLNHYFYSRTYDQDRQRLVRSQAEAEKALRLDPNNTDALLALGLHRQFLGERDRAQDYLDRALAADPQNFKAVLAQSQQLSGHPAKAKFLLEAAGRLARPAEVLYYAGLELNWSWRFEESKVVCERAIAAQPFWRTFVQRAVVEEATTADPVRMNAWLDKVPDSKRDEPRVAFMRFSAALLQRNGAAALRAVTSLAGDYWTDSFYTGPKAFLLAMAHEQAGQGARAAEQWQVAERVVREKLAADPSDLILRSMLALSQAAQHRQAEAKTLADACANDDRLKEFTQAIEALADAYIRLGDPDRAIELLRQIPTAPLHSGGVYAANLGVSPRWSALRDRPGYARLYAELKGREVAADDASPVAATEKPAAVSPARELANKALAILDGIDVTREDLALAEDRAQQAVKLDPSDGEAWAASSIAHGAYVYRGWDTSAARREQSRVAAERAIRLAPKSVAARLAQAGAWSSFNVNRTETEKLLREIIEEHPEHKPTLRFLALTVRGRGDLEECFALNERSAALPGGDPLALYNNARYLLQAGRQEEAYVTLNRSLAQQPFSSALVMKTMMEINWRGDLDTAEATQRRIPPAVLLEDRANYISGLLRFYRRDAEGALRTWSAFPRDVYMDFQFEGPKGILIGHAYELDGRDAAAKIEWRTALQIAEQRLAAAPTNPSRHYDRAFLLACLGETAAATEALRTYEQLAGIKLTPGKPMPIELALIYVRLGRLDEVFAHWPAAPARIRLDPRFDKVRADPRFAQVSK